MVVPEDIKGLAVQLPSDRLSEAVRARLAAALDGPPGAGELQSAVREAIAELLRARELVKVALAAQDGRRGEFYLVRGTSRLLDLKDVLARTAAAGPRRKPPHPPRAQRAGSLSDSAGAADVAAPAAASQGPAREASMSPDPGSLASVLEAMEQAQDLQVGDPLSSDPAVLVDRILALLQRHVPQMVLRAQLYGSEPASAETRFLLPLIGGESMPFWLRHRRPGQSLWIPDAGELPGALRGELPDGGTPDASERVTAVVPLLAPGELPQEIGLLYLSAPRAWESGDLFQLAHRLSSFVSRRWRCQRDVNLRVLTDSLTGVHNRAFFDSQFPLELERARRAGLPLTLVLGDLDLFKDVNDAYGHQCGDLVLRTVARRLQSTLRRIDHVCRIGGEEFACLLPCTSCDEAREVLARFVGRPFVVTVPRELGVGNLAVTISYGAVTYPDAGDSSGELHRKADSMLYLAKKLGRNRCCVWMPGGRHQVLPATATPPRR